MPWHFWLALNRYGAMTATVLPSEWRASRSCIVFCIQKTHFIECLLFQPSCKNANSIPLREHSISNPKKKAFACNKQIPTVIHRDAIRCYPSTDNKNGSGIN